MPQNWNFGNDCTSEFQINNSLNCFSIWSSWKNLTLNWKTHFLKLRSLKNWEINCRIKKLGQRLKAYIDRKVILHRSFIGVTVSKQKSWMFIGTWQFGYGGERGGVPSRPMDLPRPWGSTRGGTPPAPFPFLQGPWTPRHQAPGRIRSLSRPTHSKPPHRAQDQNPPAHGPWHRRAWPGEPSEARAERPPGHGRWPLSQLAAGADFLWVVILF